MLEYSNAHFSHFQNRDSKIDNYHSIILIVVFVLGCKKTANVDAPQAPIAESLIEKSTEEEASINYLIRYPKDWTITNNQNGTSSMAVSLTRKNSMSQAVIYVTAHPTRAKSAKEFFELSLREYSSTFANVSFGEDRPILLTSGVSVHELFFDATKDGRKMRYRVFHAAKDGIGYAFFVTSPIESFTNDNAAHYEGALRSIYIRGYKLENTVKRPHYSINYPENWTVAGDESSSNTYARSPPLSDDDYREWIALFCDKASEEEPHTLRTFANLMMMEEKKYGLRLIAERKIALKNGLEVYETDFERKLNDREVRVKLVFALKSNIGCVIRFVAEPKSFDRYESDFDNAVESFRIHP